MIYLLCGFMGSGKSTLMERLASTAPESGDSDVLVYDSVRSDYESLGEAIEAKGWDWFRQAEFQAIENYVKTPREALLSLGGGALGQDLLDHLLTLKHVQILWLDTSFEECWQRVQGDEGRPLVKKGREFLENLYKERYHFYAQSHVRLDSRTQETLVSWDSLRQLAPS